MKASEKYKAEFLKPKKGQMFKRKEYRETRRGKVLGFNVIRNVPKAVELRPSSEGWYS